jgi:hypothetical protein
MGESWAQLGRKICAIGLNSLPSEDALVCERRQLSPQKQKQRIMEIPLCSPTMPELLVSIGPLDGTNPH